jgi:hypothetical protein
VAFNLDFKLNARQHVLTLQALWEFLNPSPAFPHSLLPSLSPHTRPLSAPHPHPVAALCALTSFAAAQVVTGLCVSLFVAALFLTIFWRIPLEGATLALGHRRVKKGLFSGKRSRDVA